MKEGREGQIDSPRKKYSQKALKNPSLARVKTCIYFKTRLLISVTSVKAAN